MGKPLRVLLIEDSENDSELLLLELKRVGYDVEFERVETEAEMRAMLSEKKWDLILSDYTLPTFSAPQALQTLKLSGQDTPFIILSGTIEEDIALGALQAGADDFLVKGKFARLGPAIERELHEAEARRQSKLAEERIKYHARLLRHINDAVIATDDQFRITAWNRSAERIYGWTTAEVMGRNIDEILKSGLSEEQQTEAKELLKQRSSIRSERIHSNKNGQPVYVEENTIALTDEHNKITGYVSVNRDITERKKAEEAVLESEARYHHVLDAMMEGCQIIGFDWRYVYVNDVVVSQGKQTREELLNHTMMEVYPGIENTELFDILRECMEQRKPRRMENPFTFPNGSLGWFELSIQPAREGIFILSTDITERKRAEEQLRRSEENFSKAFSSSPTALMITRRTDGKYLELNKAYTSIVGYERGELIGRLTTDFNIFINPDQGKEIVSQLVANGSLYNYEAQIQNKSGELRTVLASLELIQFSGEDCILTTFVDITERKQAEEVHERLAAIVESSEDAIISKTLDGIITSWNTGAEKIYGYKADEVIGQSVSILIPSELPDQLDEFLELVRMGKSIRYLETVRLRKDGQRIMVSLTISPISNAGGSIIGASTIARDITERKQNEEKIAYQSHLLENVNDAIIATDAQFNLTSWNHAAAKLYGYAADEALGHKVQEILRSELKEEERSAAIQSLKQSGSYRMEVLQHHKDGHAFWVEGGTFTMKEADGRISGYVSINRDITERKQAEEAVRAKNEEIKAMSQQLWQAAKLATMGELAASIAHELNNPLATVSLRVEMLQSQFTAADPQSKSLEIIASEVRRMSSLVTNLLQFSRRSSSQISTINVNSELEDTLELVQYHLRKNSIVTIQELSPDVPLVQADRQQLRQVFLNLFTNASDAMPLGGMLTIRSWTEEKPDSGITTPLKGAVTRSLGLPASDRPQVFIEVSDSGEGISPDTLQRIWEPFYTTKPEGKGTGLGLAICRRIIQEHNGTIDVFSEGIPGKGTTVRLSLPAVAEK